MTENMLRKGSIRNGGVIDCNLGAFPLFNMLASAIPVFARAVSWSFWFFFDGGRALRDTTVVGWCLRTGIGNCYIILFRMLSLVLQSFRFCQSRSS